MKIGMMVHSQTGNTYSVAQRLQERLLEAGHTVNLEKIVPVNEKEMKPEKIELLTNPTIDGYDILIFACPVWGFSLSAVMKVYLNQLSSLDHKNALCFVTQFFPFAWMGGNNAVKNMKELCKSKGIHVSETGVINWSNSKRSKSIEQLADQFVMSCK
jgi:NAD(P)H dehydrogenase (quinone)